MKPSSISWRLICTACLLVPGCGGNAHEPGEISNSGGAGESVATGGVYVGGTDGGSSSTSAGGSGNPTGGASTGVMAAGGSIATQSTASGGTATGNTTIATGGFDTSGGTSASGGQSTRTSTVLDGTCPVHSSFGTSPCEDYPEGYVCHYMAMTGPPGGFTSVSLPCECRTDSTTGKRVWWCTVT